MNFASYLELVADDLIKQQNEMRAEITKAYDECLLENLEPYGITKFNYKEYVDRLRFVHYDKPYGKLMTDTQTAVFLDGRFIFCIIKHFDYETDRFGKMSFKYDIEVRHNRRDC